MHGMGNMSVSVSRHAQHSSMAGGAAGEKVGRVGIAAPQVRSGRQCRAMAWARSAHGFSPCVMNAERASCGSSFGSPQRAGLPT